MIEVICGRCRRSIDDHAVQSTSPTLFESCTEVIAVDDCSVMFRYRPGVICTMVWPG